MNPMSTPTKRMVASVTVAAPTPSAGRQAPPRLLARDAMEMMRIAATRTGNVGRRASKKEYAVATASAAPSARWAYSPARSARANISYEAMTTDAVPATSLVTFASERADLPLALAPGLLADLHAQGLDAVYREIEQPLIGILADLAREETAARACERSGDESGAPRAVVADAPIATCRRSRTR